MRGLYNIHSTYSRKAWLSIKDQVYDVCKIAFQGENNREY